MGHALALTSFAATGARPSVPLRMVRANRAATAARTVRTSGGVALFDEAGRYVGVVITVSEHPVFGRGGQTVLLRR